MSQARKILVVDDEAHIRHIVTMKLRNAGFQVVTAADGEEALELCSSDRPDLIITDFQMPLLSGLDLCKRLRTIPSLRDVPAIMLTARGFDIEPQEMAEAGISAVLAKPFSPREVLGKVEQMLARGGTETAACNK